MAEAAYSLNSRQLRFAHHYLIGGNAAEAYRKAGYLAQGGSVRTNASRLLTKANIVGYIGERRETLVQKFEVREEQVLRELKTIAFSSITDYLTFGPEGVTMHDSALIDPGKTGAIAFLRASGPEPQAISIRLHDKLSALRLLGRYLHMWGCPNCGNRPNARWVRVSPGVDLDRILCFDEMPGGAR